MKEKWDIKSLLIKDEIYRSITFCFLLTLALNIVCILLVLFNIIPMENRTLNLLTIAFALVSVCVTVYQTFHSSIKKITNVLMMILLTILQILFLVFFFVPNFKSPQIYSIYVEPVKIGNEDMTKYTVRVVTSQNVPNVMIRDNETALIKDCSYHDIEKNRVFDTVIEIEGPDKPHDITAEIIYQNGKCVGNDLKYTIPRYISQTEDMMTSDFKMTVECKPILFSLTDQNATIEVRTSKKAKKVLMSCSSGDAVYFTDKELKTSDNLYWYFNADFYKEGNYKIAITAFDEGENCITDDIEVSYPF